jgi:hypothetical protein
MRWLPFAIAALCAWQQPARDATPRAATGTASLAGTVVASGTGTEPVRLARVTLNSTDGTVGRTETTDDAGRFVFRDLPAGRYKASAAKPAWLTANYGATKPERPGTAIALGDGQRMGDVTIRMTRGAVISGVLLDETGQPAAGVSINVGRIAMVAGERTFTGVGGNAARVDTDDTGAYRIFGLPPGDFVVMASVLSTRMNIGALPTDFLRLTPEDVSRARQAVRQGTGAGTPGVANRSQPPMTGQMVKPAAIFYPGTTDPGNATAVSVSAGEERAGIDMTMRLVPTVRIEGVVTNAAGVPEPNFGVVAISKGLRIGGMGIDVTQSMTDKNGHYQLTGIPPGDYTLMGGGQTGFAQIDITVVGQDMTVPLTAQPPVPISGRVVFEGAAAPPSTASMGYTLRATGILGTLLAAGQQPQELTNGTFATHVLPGKYQVEFTGVPAGWSAKSAIARGQDTLDAPLDIGPSDPPADWVVTFTNRPSELAGSLVDAGGRPATEYFVVVFSADRHFWTPPTRRVVQTRPASDGAFSLKGLPAGDYFVAALTDIEPGDTLTPDLLESAIAGAARVTIADGQRTTVPLRINGG